MASTPPKPCSASNVKEKKRSARERGPFSASALSEYSLAMIIIFMRRGERDGMSALMVILIGVPWGGPR